MKNYQTLSLLAWIILPLCVSCQDPGSVIDELEKLGIDRYLDINYSRVEHNNLIPGWKTFYFDTSDCKCVFGREFFLFSKNNEGENNNLVFALQGGGACWPGMEQMCKEEAAPEDVYNAAFYHEDHSPVKDWNSIFVPYCDGSVHAGDNAADYNGDGVIDYWHWGLHSTSAASVLAKQLFPETEKIYITGCSAGGYGTFMALLLMRWQFPDAGIYVMNESGPGLNNPDDKETWEIIKDTWNLDHMIPEDCEKCDGQQIFLYEWMLSHDPDLKIGLYSSYRDEVVGEEFLKMEPKDFRDHLLSASGSIHEAYPERFNRFIIKGRTHCVEDYGHEIDGTSFIEWIEMLITDDPEWKDLLE